MRITPVSWSLLTALCLVAPLSAQSAYAPGYDDVTWSDPTSTSSAAVIDARLYYPAVQSGAGAQILPKVGGWPTIVFLHGYGMIGSDYHDLGSQLAKAGFVAVMLDTAPTNPFALERAAVTVFGLLDFENQRGRDLQGALDMNNVGLLGHSMGGGVAGLVCADDPAHVNPGYKVALAIAPVFPGAIASQIKLPFGIISGEGDPVTFEALHADPYYDALQPTSGVKFHYSMGLACDHDSIVGINVVGGYVNQQVFARSMKVTKGFFRHFLARDPRGLHEVFGQPAMNDVNFDELRRQAAVPQVWVDKEMQIGDQTRLSVTSENGFAAMIASVGSTPVPITTPFGELLVDPNALITVAEAIITTQQLDVVLVIPNDTSLVGLPFTLQGVGETPLQLLQLGSGLNLTIE